MKELQVVYRIACTAAEADARAQALAVEQSIEMPPEAVTSDFVRERVIGEVLAVEDAGGAFEVRIGLSLESTGGEGGQLLNMLFGNSSLQAEVRLLDFELTEQAAHEFGGPRHGIAGLRRAVGRPAGALTCSALKPLGSNAAELAELACALAAGGIDVIKDDHGLADQSRAPFELRVPTICGALARAGLERCLYVPSLGGGPGRLQRQLQVARDAGVRMVMLAPMISGLGALQEIAGEFLLLAHPAMAGAARIAQPALLGKLFRLCGADATIFPNHGGRFSYSEDTCRGIAAQAREPLHGLAPCMPVPAGGMTPARVSEMLSFYGDDVMLLIGGALLASPLGIEAAAADFVRAVRGAVR
ncbi:MAG: hypothetical protein KDH15_20020 [Rhodocyclaceae bacterium]|nr:hypothetical protein [Rhodocyclaceae bacterium]